jgi:hypothetical protein
VGADVNARPLASDDCVIVDLRLIAYRNQRVRCGYVEKAVAGMQVGGLSPAKLDLLANNDRSLAEKQHRLQEDRGAAHLPTGRERLILKNPQALQKDGQAVPRVQHGTTWWVAGVVSVLIIAGFPYGSQRLLCYE